MDSSGLDGLTVFPLGRALEKERGEWRERKGEGAGEKELREGVGEGGEERVLC